MSTNNHVQPIKTNTSDTSDTSGSSGITDADMEIIQELIESKEIVNDFFNDSHPDFADELEKIGQSISVVLQDATPEVRQHCGKLLGFYPQAGAEITSRSMT